MVYILFFFILSQISWFMIQVAASCAFLVMWSMNFPSGSSLMWWSRKLRNFLKQSIINYSQNECKNKETHMDRGWYDYCRVQENWWLYPSESRGGQRKIRIKFFLEIFKSINMFKGFLGILCESLASVLGYLCSIMGFWHFFVVLSKLTTVLSCLCLVKLASQIFQNIRPWTWTEDNDFEGSKGRL